MLFESRDSESHTLISVTTIHYKPIKSHQDGENDGSDIIGGT
jgi:hypothetical protein